MSPLSPLLALFAHKTEIKETYPHSSEGTLHMELDWKKLPFPFLQQQLDRIVDIVEPPYFPGDPLSSQDRALLDPERHGPEVLGLPYWQYQHFVDIKPLAPGADVSHLDWTVSGNAGVYFSQAGKWLVTDRAELLGVDALLAALDEVIAKTSSPTPLCSLFQDDLEKDPNLLSTYIGRQIDAGDFPGAGGVRPGAGGVRPGIRPCLDFRSDL
jgi:hypothetical protein